DRAEDRSDGEELPGEDENRSDPKQRRNHTADRCVVSELEVVADRSQIVRRRHPPDRGADPQGQQCLTDGRGSDPPPRRDSARVAEGRRSDRGTGADIRREHRGEDQPGTELPPGHEEIAGAAHTPPERDANRDQTGRVDDENREMEAHETSGYFFTSRAAGT